MFGSVRAASPVRVQVDRASDAGWLGAAVVGAGSVAGSVVVFAWRAPLLALAVLALVGGAVAVWAGYAWAVLTAVLALLVGAGIVGWFRPAWLRRFCDLVAGQALRAVLYRPRWEVACLTSHVTTRAGSAVHLPALVRHRRRRGVDTLTVRMAPGQTLADWQAACPALATTFAAYSVTVDAARRAGWVTLTVQRRDPLAGEHTSTDPARHPSGPIELGRDEFGSPFTIDPTATVHLGLQGAARSGKSSAGYTLLGALAHRGDVAVVGVDPSGLLLGPFQAGPNASLIACGTSTADLDHAAKVLGELVGIMDTRIEQLRREGLDKYTGFSAAMPALWVVLEEYPGLIAALKAHDNGLKPADRLAPTVERSLGRLVKEGAKVGVCVLVLAQRMSAEALSTDDRANLAVRVTLRVDNADAVRMLHDGITTAGIERIRQFAPGVGLVESPGHPIRRVRFHYTDYQRYRERVAAGLTRTHPAQVVAAGDVIPGEVVPLREGNDVPETQSIPVNLGGAA